jgi:hypothetical protein
MTDAERTELLKRALATITAQDAEIQKLRKRAGIGIVADAISKTRQAERTQTTRLPQGRGQFRIATAKSEARSDPAKAVERLHAERADGHAAALADVAKKRGKSF